MKIDIPDSMLTNNQYQWIDDELKAAGLCESYRLMLGMNIGSLVHALGADKARKCMFGLIYAIEHMDNPK